MNREVHVRLREGLRGKFPRSTRLPIKITDTIMKRWMWRFLYLSLGLSLHP